jgi:hypothetical protein
VAVSLPLLFSCPFPLTVYVNNHVPSFFESRKKSLSLSSDMYLSYSTVLYNTHLHAVKRPSRVGLVTCDHSECCSISSKGLTTTENEV